MENVVDALANPTGDQQHAQASSSGQKKSPAAIRHEKLLRSREHYDLISKGGRLPTDHNVPVGNAQETSAATPLIGDKNREALSAKRAKRLHRSKQHYELVEGYAKTNYGVQSQEPADTLPHTLPQSEVDRPHRGVTFSPQGSEIRLSAPNDPPIYSNPDETISFFDRKKYDLWDKLSTKQKLLRVFGCAGAFIILIVVIVLSILAAQGKL